MFNFFSVVYFFILQLADFFFSGYIRPRSLMCLHGQLRCFAE